MHMRQLVIVRVGINSFFSFVITVTPDFLGTTWVGLTHLLSENEYLRLNGNDFKSGFGGWTLEGIDSIDCGGNSSICGLQLHAFASSWK